MPNDWKLQHALAPGHVDQLVELFQAEWWTTGREKRDVEVMLAASDLIFAYVNREGALVAFARVLTDRLFGAFIVDVIVRPDQRGRGLDGRKISPGRLGTRIPEGPHEHSHGIL